MQKNKQMKKYIHIALSLLIASLLTLTGCDSNSSKSEKKEGGVKAGNIAEADKSNPELTISLDNAAILMQKHNRLTQKWFNYTYTRAWIETLQTEENTFLYYLGVEASLEGKNNEKAYSCYAVYSELTVNNNELYFYPNAYQQSCMGKCCSSCELEMFEDNVQGCIFKPSANESEECKGRGGCVHNESIVPDEEQAKDDMI